MQIKRLTITLPARLKNTAHHDARAIAEAMAQALYNNGGQVSELTVLGHGQNGLALAQRVGAKLPKPKGGTGHGG
jgi:hypothetical protein